MIDIKDGGFTDRVISSRKKRKLWLPYGAKAHALGLGTKDPPWKFEAASS